MMTKEPLLPCPFCGSYNVEMKGQHAPEWWVRCKDCNAASATRPMRQQAAQNWNRREPPKQAPGITYEEMRAHNEFNLRAAGFKV
jgi:Lar family restriction alleviation protein